MLSSFTIQLHGLRFVAAHGLYPEEAAVGNEFEVNLSLSVAAPEKKVITIHDTINYAVVYQTVAAIFSVPQALLETLAVEIAGALKEKFPALRNTSVQISKLHPPITGFIGSVSVTYQKEYEAT